jgi:hypothetical protein
MRTTEGFADKVSRREQDIAREAREEVAKRLESAQRAERESSEFKRQRESRLAREQDRRGYTPEEVWGEDSAEAQACREFLAYMAECDFPGATVLTHEGKVLTEPRTQRRWLRKEVVEEPIGKEEDWSIKGYGIGFTPQLPWRHYHERMAVDDETYPYSSLRHGKIAHQDVFLCEDGMLRVSSGGKLSPLPGDKVNPDVPKPPEIGAVTDHFRHLGGGGTYYVADENLEAPLVQIATHHTRIEQNN